MVAGHQAHSTVNDMPLNTEVPQWLVDTSKWIQASSERTVSDFFQGAQAVQQLSQNALAIQSAKNNLEIQPQMNMLKLGEMQLQFQEQKDTIAEMDADKNAAAAWMQEKQVNPQAPEPAWQSEKYQQMSWQRDQHQQMIDNRKLQIENGNLATRTAVQSNKAFLDEVNKLSPTDPSRAYILGLPANENGTPSAAQLSALQDAQKAAAVKAQSALDAAQAAGGQLKVISGPKGLTTAVVPETNKAGKQDPVIALQNQQQTYSNLLEQSDNPDDQKWYQDKIDELGQRINRLSNFAGTKESVKSEVIQLNKAGIPTNRVTTVTSPGKISTAPQVITDKSGKKWTYTGTMSDPTKDKDPSHWKQQ